MLLVWMRLMVRMLMTSFVIHDYDDHTDHDAWRWMEMRPCCVWRWMRDTWAVRVCRVVTCVGSMNVLKERNATSSQSRIWRRRLVAAHSALHRRTSVSLVVIRIDRVDIIKVLVV